MPDTLRPYGKPTDFDRESFRCVTSELGPVVMLEMFEQFMRQRSPDTATHVDLDVADGLRDMRQQLEAAERALRGE